MWIAFCEHQSVQFGSPGTLTQSTVTSMLMRAFQIQSADLKRGLGLLLVILILYGTTVEAAHRHGRIPPTGNTETSRVDTDQSSTPVGTKVGCNDCLICQLHQSFNTTLVSFRVADPPTQPQAKLTAPVPRVVNSQVTSPRSGRAPPSVT